MSMAQQGCILETQLNHTMWATLSRHHVPRYVSGLGRELEFQVNNAPHPTQLTQHTNKLTHNITPCPPNANETHYILCRRGPIHLWNVLCLLLFIFFLRTRLAYTLVKGKGSLFSVGCNRRQLRLGSSCCSPHLRPNQLWNKHRLLVLVGGVP